MRPRAVTVAEAMDAVHELAQLLRRIADQEFITSSTVKKRVAEAEDLLARFEHEVEDDVPFYV